MRQPPPSVLAVAQVIHCIGKRHTSIGPVGSIGEPEYLSMLAAISHSGVRKMVPLGYNCDFDD